MRTPSHGTEDPAFVALHDYPASAHPAPSTDITTGVRETKSMLRRSDSVDGSAALWIRPLATSHHRLNHRQRPVQSIPWIVVLAVILALASTRPPTATAGDDIDDAIDEITTQLEHGQQAMEYAAAVLNDYQNGTTIAKWSPISMEVEPFVTAAAECRAAIDAVSYSPLSQFPPIPDPATTDFPIYRNSMRALTSTLESEVQRYLSNGDQLERIQYVVLYCERLDQMMIAITKFLGQLYDKFALLPYVEEYIGLRWVDYELVVKPATSALVNSARASRTRLALAHKQRREDLDRAISNTNLLLADEAARLQAAASLAEQARLKLEEAEASLQLLYATVSRLQADLSRSDSLIQQINARLRAATVEVENWRAALTSINGSIASNESQYAVPFESSQWRCPEGYPWASCNHTSYKAAYSNNRTRLQNEIAALRSRRDSANVELGNARNRQAQVSTELSNEQAHRVQISSALATAHANYARDAERYRTEFLAYIRDSRLTERLSAESGNASDVSTLASLARLLSP